MRPLPSSASASPPASAATWRRLAAHPLSAVLASALLCGLYARGGHAWVLGWVALLPWLHSQDNPRPLGRQLLWAWVFTVAYTAAVFGWFASAIGQVTGWGAVVSLAALLLVAPLFQPQILAFVLVRQLCAAWPHPGRVDTAGPVVGPVLSPLVGPWLQALAATAAWVGTETYAPRWLGDSFGHGLYPSLLMRQAADLGGVAGLTVLLLLAQQTLLIAWRQRRAAPRACWATLLLAVALPALLLAYGAWRTGPGAVASGSPTVRIGLVQSNLVDYEQARRERGAAAVVREVLDIHYAMSYDAVERQGADALLWSETVYPTTFGQPKSEAGAELDREILAIVQAAGVPLVFGTYDRDDLGEYNAAAFVAPQRGLLGLYRKTRLFPLTEQVPDWLDGPMLRRWLPWAGQWRAGDGARVFPLLLRDGREVPVQPLICLDDVDAGLAIDGARLGAQLLLGLSNDAWFSRAPQGAALHQAVAAFRSIETRLPQFRVTTNGYSAVIDAQGTVIASARMGERSLVMGSLPAATPPRTLMLIWGDWVGRAAAWGLAALGLLALLNRWERRHRGAAAGQPEPASGSAAEVLTIADSGTQAATGLPANLPTRGVLLPPAARWLATGLRLLARGSLLWMIGQVLLGDGSWQTQTLAQIRGFGLCCLIPEAAAWCLLRAFRAQLRVQAGALVFSRGGQDLRIALAALAPLQPWRLPLPGPGATLTLREHGVAPLGLITPNPWALAQALAAAGGPDAPADPGTRVSLYTRARLACQPGRLQQPVIKFGVFPLLLALPAFRLHQHIAYGGSFGEWLSFGPGAYLLTLGLWWAAWAIGVVLCAAALRTLIEAGTWAGVCLRPERSLQARRWLERAGLLALYAGLPAWLLARSTLG